MTCSPLRIMLFSTVLALAVMLFHDPAVAAPPRFEGPFDCSSLAVFLVHPGGPMTVTLRVQLPGPTVNIGWSRRQRTALLYHLEGPDGTRLETGYRRFNDIEGQAVRPVVLRRNDAPKGIYRLRYTTLGGPVDIVTRPAMSFGILPRRARLSQAVDKQFDSVYVHVPADAKDFRPSVSSGKGRLADEQGKPLAQFDRKPPRVKLPGKPVVWSMSLQLPSSSRHGYEQTGDFDAILCPDEKSARAIGSGLVAAGDGRLFPHPFQAAMWDRLRAMKPADIEIDPVPDLRKFEEQLVGHPRNTWLLGPWGAFSRLPWLLANQSLDNPLADRSTALTLGAVYSLDEPLNPFYKNEKILNRLVLSEFHRYLRTRQNDTLHAGAGQFVATDAFTADRTPFALAAGLLDDQALRQLWFDGARRHVERYAFGRTSCENQSSHVALNLYALFLGSGDDLYRTLAADWMESFVDPALNPPMRAGYLMEGYGPDATYQGLCANQMAWYYHWSGDANTLKALKTIYELFNHTVAPEPGGGVLGASNFSHRTAGSWAERQYGGGTLSMAPHLEAAAAWHQDLRQNDAASRTQAAGSIRNDLQLYWGGQPREPIRKASEYRYITRYLYYPKDDIPKALLPAAASDRFVRNFDNRFLAVRRPGYYALAYLGKPDPDVKRKRAREGRNTVQRRTGGGLSMFWTPEFGSALLSMNWHAHTHHMTRIDSPGGKIDYPDYYTLEADFDEKDAVLTARCRMMTHPVAVVRRTRFLEKHLRQELELTFEKDLSCDAMIEQLPFPLTDKLKRDDKSANVQAFVEGQWVDLTKPAQTDRVRLVDVKTGKSVQVTFDRRYPVQLGRPIDQSQCQGGASSQIGDRVHGLIEVNLGNRFKEGETVKLNYTLE